MKPELREILTEMASEEMPHLIDRMLEELRQGLADRLVGLPGIAKANPTQVANVFFKALQDALKEEKDGLIGACEFIMEEFCDEDE